MYIEKANSFEELVNKYKKNFFMLIKFGSQENLKKLQHGQIYMKNLKYFNNLESDDLSGKPDKYDGKSIMTDCKVISKNPVTKETMFEYNANVVFLYGLAENPIFVLLR